MSRKPIPTPECDAVTADAEERGFVIEEVAVELPSGTSRTGWLIYDLACHAFVPDAVNWTSLGEVNEFIREASG